jgi:hypothetical protein
VRRSATASCAPTAAGRSICWVAASRDLGRLIETGVPSGVTAVLVGSVQTDLEHTAAADIARGV